MPIQRLPGAVNPGPVRRSRRPAEPTQQANGTAPGSGIASGGRASSVLTSLGMTTHARRRVAAWDDLDAVEQSLLVVAAREHTLGHACASWSAQPLRRADVEMTMQAATRLLDYGFIGFYRVENGYPDLCEGDLNVVLGDRSHWECGHDQARRVGLYLTTAGEDLVLGP
jgi:hypothetical protein